MLTQILNTYADEEWFSPQNLAGITRMINVVCIGQLKDYDRAITVYQTFIDGHPGHRLNRFLVKVIESLNMMKENKLNAVVPQS